MIVANDALRACCFPQNGALPMGRRSPRYWWTGLRLALLLGLLVVVHGCSATPPAANQALPFFRGINLPSGTFGGQRKPREYGLAYIYPGSESIDYYSSKGFNLFRIAFLWESLQPTLFGQLSMQELKRIDSVVNRITAKGLYVLLDVHNYGNYGGKKLGADVPTEALADLWDKLASHYKDNNHVLFDLMNEPNNMAIGTVKAMSEAAIDAIRAAGAENVIVIEGNAWSGAYHWLASKSDSLAGLATRGGNVLFSPHQYLDKDGSGTHSECVDPTIGLVRLQGVSAWAREQRVRLVLGEFGAGANLTCEAAVTSMLRFIEENIDVWAGWIWFAGGPWWGNYFSSIEPQNGVDRPQMHWLMPFLGAH